MGAPALAPRRAPAPSRRTPSRKPRKPPPKARASAAKARPRARAASAPARLPRRNLAQPALAGAALIPQAAVGAVGAVRDISDSSLIVRLTRGRGWIAVLCALLAGIVALNVFSLSINSTSGRVSQQISEVERANSALRASLAEELSAGRVEEAAARLGLATPPGDQVTYLDASDKDLDELLALLDNDTVLTDDLPDQSPTIAYEDPYPSAPSDTSAPPSTATAPSASAPSTSAPAAPPPSAPSAGGTTGGVGL